MAFGGWWRVALTPWRIRANRMTVARLGLAVPAEHEVRVNGILASFAGGFNAMLTGPADRAWEDYSDSLPSLFRPFAHEGAAMGLTPRRMFRCTPAEFERDLVQRRPDFRYLYYVGLGFWSGMRRHDPQRVVELVRGLDPLHGHLCYDGYGFKHAFFDYPKDASALRRLDGLPSYARNAAYQGVGRALFFYYVGAPDALIDRLTSLGGQAADAAAGVALAAVFVFPDRLEFAQRLAEALPPRWQASIHLGMCFGLKARSINDPEQFERDAARMGPDVAEAIHASVSACDRAEAQVRAEGGADAYRRWRGLVTEWMASCIEYPLAGVRSGSEALCRPAATA